MKSLSLRAMTLVMLVGLFAALVGCDGDTPIESKTTVVEPNRPNVVATGLSPAKVAHSTFTSDGAGEFLKGLRDAENLPSPSNQQKVADMTKAMLLAVDSNPKLDGGDGYCLIELVYQALDGGYKLSLADRYQRWSEYHVFARDINTVLNGTKTGDFVRVGLVPDTPYFRLYPTTSFNPRQKK